MSEGPNGTVAEWSTPTASQTEVPTVSGGAPMRWPRMLSRRAVDCGGDRSGRIWRFLRGRERNHIAALFSLLGVILISAALADNEWFAVSGGNCQLSHLGANQFYSWGHFRYEFRRSTDANVTPDWNDLKADSYSGFKHVTYLVGNDRVVDCVTPDIIDLLHGVMGSCVLALISNLAALYVDLVGVKNSFLRWIRRNAILSVVSVVFTVIVIGLAYWATLLLAQLQRATSRTPDLVRVEFADGFYLVVCSALMGICAVAANLLRASLYFKRRADDRVALMENYSESTGSRNSIGAGGNASLADVYNLFPGIFRPPPPAYSP